MLQMPTYDSIFVCLDHICNLLWGLLREVIVVIRSFLVSHPHSRGVCDGGFCTGGVSIGTPSMLGVCNSLFIEEQTHQTALRLI